jgi:8-oxo-dGTP pyrophosphatase MutT (NUDIX family)
MSVHPWKKIATKKLADFRVYGVRSDTKVSPRTGQSHEFYIIEAVNWVTVLPITTDGKIVMVEQYRHGSDTIELEIPGGMMDPEDADPVSTGMRELREETGYEGQNARLIGQTYPNPAIMNNVCYTILVEQCVCKHPLKFDETEDLHVVLVDPAEIPKLIRENRIGHSLVVVAFYFWEHFSRAAK